MTPRRARRRDVAILAAAAVLGLASGAGAAPDVDPDLLAGPTVVETGEMPPFLDVRPPALDVMRPELVREFLSALREVDLTPAQRAMARREVTAMRRARRAFRIAERDRLAELRQRRREAGADPAKLEALRRDARRLAADRPDPADALRRIWDGLDEPRQDALRAAIGAARAERNRTRPGMVDPSTAPATRPSGEADESTSREPANS